MSEEKCKGCGKTIIWGMTEDGKKIPLDPAPPVYTLSGFASPVDSRYSEVARAKRTDFMVSHFATCPQADRFSANKKLVPPAELLLIHQGVIKPRGQRG